MKVLAGGPARETESLVYRLHREGLECQGAVEVWHDVQPDPGGARWTGEKVRAVAASRQAFMEEAFGGYDALFMVDTDVVVGPGVLDRMLAVDADVVYGVFWTDSTWGGRQGLWPQVWFTHPYGFEGHEQAAVELMVDGVHEIEVFGGGACTLIRGHALQECRYYPILDALQHGPGMSSGEDRTFALHCATRGIRQVAVTGLPIVHMHCGCSGKNTCEVCDRTAVEAARSAVGL